ncbi:hypothetical protein M758_3G199600 [Ceratodon purpureus]|uniref:Uncharacterized protein n=1 Tax=Ceratodon purpureus TaxID=3225 RepID=A0A8T0INY7_CERPU|nr:hypothetical protein KC19_3G200700 [Ceratodon purpureus]KAG0623759.1 hypothetical protein M758_3G199600 [Ceratodon purpureus]
MTARIMKFLRFRFYQPAPTCKCTTKMDLQKCSASWTSVSTTTTNKPVAMPAIAPTLRFSLFFSFEDVIAISAPASANVSTRAMGASAGGGAYKHRFVVYGSQGPSFPPQLEV